MNQHVNAAPGTVLREYARAELESAITHLGWRGGRLHAGVHQARKALRRTRATELLGTAQDLSLLLEHCGRRSPFSKSDRNALRRFAEPNLARLRQRIALTARRSQE